MSGDWLARHEADMATPAYAGAYRRAVLELDRLHGRHAAFWRLVAPLWRLRDHCHGWLSA